MEEVSLAVLLAVHNFKKIMSSTSLCYDSQRCFWGQGDANVFEDAYCCPSGGTFADINVGCLDAMGLSVSQNCPFDGFDGFADVADACIPNEYCHWEGNTFYDLQIVSSSWTLCCPSGGDYYFDGTNCRCGGVVQDTNDHKPFQLDICAHENEQCDVSKEGVKARVPVGDWCMCECEEGWGGQLCEHRLCSEEDNECSLYTTSSADLCVWNTDAFVETLVCECLPKYDYMSDCKQTDECYVTCEHGTCESVGCFCDTGYEGTNCDIVSSSTPSPSKSASASKIVFFYFIATNVLSVITILILY